ncbi:hypothetical protein [Alteromonas sp. a30]|uniref:hypothetical protein n=1 Tax=Alteromonas sp. a30 TaxID=2730917 RepID=UPI0022832901|nr:hypothetical protein [Alteromonas sp. a30]MCY7295699.1 hypothetical protein [Alteromonas sp. a30]
MIIRLLTLLCCMSLATLTSAAQESRIPLKSYWIKNTQGDVIFDPQTSALVYRQGQLLSIGDGSAHKDMQLQLLPIDPSTAILSENTFPLAQSNAVKNGCFSPYLDYGPDLEGMAMHPNDEKVMIIVTEDAYHFELKGDCLSRYGDTGSTKHPTVLLRVEIQDDQSGIITHTKPLRFPKKYRIGNSPNDGVEGLTFGAGNTLYLGLEKDASGHARIFELQITDAFWESPEAATVKDSGLDIPHIEDGKNHPINALAYYADSKNSGFLLAAARNDNQVWIIDTLKQKPSKIVYLDFLAESLSENCPKWETMNNYSIEGMTVVNQNLWLINDPWKVNYPKNATCKDMLPFYERMAPLLTKLPLKPEWIRR